MSLAGMAQADTGIEACRRLGQHIHAVSLVFGRHSLVDSGLIHVEHFFNLPSASTTTTDMASRRLLRAWHGAAFRPGFDFVYIKPVTLAKESATPWNQFIIVADSLLSPRFSLRPPTPLC